ncbi:MAG: histidine kinase dimerization/phospho-acceptor domain-containing protein [Chloroflexota bacterium]
MSHLPIRKLTLYKQGIGYFERQGQFEGTAVSLVVPRENINDTLKSLHVINKQGGRVLGVDYETPTDKNTLLDDLPIKLKNRSSMVDLLVSLRGSLIMLQLKNDDSKTGRLIGVESSLDSEGQNSSVLLQREETPSQIDIYPIDQLSGISLKDNRAQADVNFFLDMSQMEQSKTAVSIQLSEGSHDLEIAYLAPSPTWRVGYQLSCTGDNEAVLTGWGIFENILEEDLEDVSLTLKSGRPITFEYNLYESYLPTRPQVSDDPTAFEEISQNPLIAESLTTISHEIRTPISAITGYAEILLRGMYGDMTKEQQESVEMIQKSSQKVSEAVGNLLGISKVKIGRGGRFEGDRFLKHQSGPLGDLKASSAYFMPMLIGNAEPEYLTYDVETAVSVRRKQSAMVPIVQKTVHFKELCVYNGDKMPNHPLRVWHFENSTGKALEQGPVTLVNQGTYLGEGLIRFTGVDDSLQIPYALEFGIVVSEKAEKVTSGTLEITFDKEKQRAIVKRFTIHSTTHIATSHIKKEIELLIERRDPNYGEFFEMPKPSTEEKGHTRWSLIIPGNQEETFTIKIRTIQENDVDISTWKEETVQKHHKKKLISDNRYEKFKAYFDEVSKANKLVEENSTLQNEHLLLLNRQQQLRENLGALGESKREKVIRNQILDDLEISENRRRELETMLEQINEDLKTIQNNQDKKIENIFD